ncbi:MAG: terminase small subunit [Bacteroidales bacterium]|jgi:hypothetical protein|nr:terminase small subunit [Bacteroidales bacterium]
MGAPKGNTYWEHRKKHGRGRIFETPEDLLEICIKYFDWVDSNPLYKSEIVKYKDFAELMNVPVCRAYTKDGLSDFCQVSCFNTIAEYKKRSNDFSKVIAYVEGKIYNQKFENAAAGLLNSNIIARDLGLRDSIDQTTTIIEQPLFTDDIDDSDD